MVSQLLRFLQSGALSARGFSGLGDDHAGEHEGAACDEADAEGFSQDEDSAYGGEEGFHGEDDGGVSGVGCFLGDYLEGEGNADGEDAAVEDRDGCLKGAGKGCAFGGYREDEAEDGDDDVLSEGKAQGVHPGSDPGDDEDVGGPEEGSDKYEKVAGGDDEAGLDREDVQSYEGEDCACPDSGAGFFPQEGSDDGDEDDVQGGDEAGVACGGGDESDLLEGRAGKEDEAGAAGPQDAGASGEGSDGRGGCRFFPCACRRSERHTCRRSGP